MPSGTRPDREVAAARAGGGFTGGKGGAQQGRGGFSSGMYGATARRTSVPQREYDMNMNNAQELAKTVVGFMGGPVTTAGKMIAGYGPEFTGYRGKGYGPGSYDPTNRAMRGGAVGQQMPGGSPNKAPRGLQAGMPAAGLRWTPTTYGPKQISIPGGLNYGMTFNPWTYFK